MRNVVPANKKLVGRVAVVMVVSVIEVLRFTSAVMAAIAPGDWWAWSERGSVAAAPAADRARGVVTPGVANASRPCTWSRLAAKATEPVAAALATAEVVGTVAC